MSSKPTSGSKRPTVHDITNEIERDNTNEQGARGYTEKETTGGVLRYIDSPTLVVEGPDDVAIYRWIVEEYFHNIGIEVVSVGGRSQVEKCYNEVTLRRADFPLFPIVFTADQDMDVFSPGTPQGYDDIIWTKGYSIENDLYAIGENVLLRLMSRREKKLYNQVLKTIIEWFAFEFQECRNRNPYQISGKRAVLNKIVPRGTGNPPTQTKIGKKFRRKRAFNPRHHPSPKPVTTPKKKYLDIIKGNYQCNLKGKYLFDILSRYVDYEGRVPRFGRFHLWSLVFTDPQSKRWREDMVEEINKRIAKDKKRITTMPKARSSHSSSLVYKSRRSGGSRGVSVNNHTSLEWKL